MCITCIFGKKADSMKKEKNILITGGAGFIGSNITEALLNDERVGEVRVIDNLATGYMHNIKEFKGHPKFEFIEGDIYDFNTCLEATKGIHRICHQAALGSVPRSINDPLNSHAANVTGTLNILNAAVKNQVERVVFASSSSVYGNDPNQPKKENRTGEPLSPYAATKQMCELYAEVFYKTYGLNYVGLRYFNIFGPRQNIQGPYAAVIPLFITKILAGEAPVINGNGSQSRDFTYVQNAVQANLKALFSDNQNGMNQVYNIACGATTSLNDMYAILTKISGTSLAAAHGPERKGDIKDSLADISKAQTLLGYVPSIQIEKGLELTFRWFQRKYNG